MTFELRLADDVHVRLAAAEREAERLRKALAAATERERLLSHELQHRVRNMLAMIRSICRRTIESGASQHEFAQHFQGRLDSIARYYSDMADPGSAGVELEDMVRNELLRVHALDGADTTIDGPPIRLSGKSLDLMNLAIHELTTNAVKFGALYHGGLLQVSWSVEWTTGPFLTFHWRETSVPLLGPAPRPYGFGRQLLEEALPYQLGATTSFELQPGGLACTISLAVPAADSTAAPDGIAPISQSFLSDAGKRA